MERVIMTLESSSEASTETAESHDDIGRRTLTKMLLGAGGAAAAAALLVPSKADATLVTPTPGGTPVFQIYDVTDYGALNNNTNPNATTAAINAAITAATATNGIVYFPRGQYAVNATLVVNAPVLLMGACGRDASYATPSYAASVIIGTQSGDLLSITGHAVQVRDLHFINNGTGRVVSTTAQPHVFAHGFEHCTFQNQAGNTSDMLYITGSNSWVSNCSFSCNEPHAYSLRCERNTNTLQNNCDFCNNAFGGVGKGVVVSSLNSGDMPQAIRIYNNLFNLSGAEQVTVTAVYGIDICNNNFADGTAYAIWVTPNNSSDPIWFVNIRGNLIDVSGAQTSGIGIYVPQTNIGVRAIAIVDNFISYCGYGVILDGYATTTSTAGGIIDARVVNNTLWDIAQTGISTNLIQQVLIQGNNLRQFGSAFSLDVVGGYLGGGASTGGDWVLIKNNFISGSTIITVPALFNGNTNYIYSENMTVQ